jgi:Xaa-Pro dipeptidase
MTSDHTPFVQRQQKLSAVLQHAGLDALVLNPGPSLTYLTGLHFHLMERPVIGVFTANSAPLIILPELETQKLTSLDYDVESTSYGEDPATWPGIFSDALKAIPSTKIGVEHNQIRLLEYRLLQPALPDASFTDATETVSKLRMFKDQSEVAIMQTAVNIAQQALEATLPMIKVGMTEKEVASEIIIQLLRHGSEGELPFQPIVSTGPNGANPHATPTERKLAAGDLLVIDYGAAHQGYISDITRTFGIVEVSPEQEKVHQIVQQANAAGREIAKPGLPCSYVDQATRQVIEQAGYGEFFTHRTGHGIGMEPHEGPYIREGNSLQLDTGMAFTIEPGIYIPDQFGVRIEDNVVITKDGLHSLTTLPRELKIIG